MKEDPYVSISRIISRKTANKNQYATFLFYMLEEAENLFGARLNPYPFMFAGINFDSQSPRISFWKNNRLELDDEYKYIFIRLSLSCRRDTSKGLWQLAHESVHLLSPNPDVGTTILEEGLATWYQMRWVEKCPEIFPEWAKQFPFGFHGTDCAYLDAYTLVSELLSVDESVLKRIRKIEPRINLITPEQILQEAPRLDEEVAANLVKQFAKIRSLKITKKLSLQSS